MRVSFSKVNKFFVALVVTVLTTIPVLAEENIISSVTISKAKDNQNAYELNIDSTQMVQYKNRIDSDGSVYFDLKNSTLAPNMGTIYDDVSDIDNVTVKQLDKNKVRIYVSGKNVENTELVFLNSVFDTKKDTNKKVTINRPINEYKSTTYYNEDLENQEDLQEWDDNSFNFSHLTTSLLSTLKNNVSGKIVIGLFLLMILAIIVKSLSKKISQDREPLIGLNNVELNEKKEQIKSTSREEALKKAQMQLSQAHQKYQQYIQNKYQTVQKPGSINEDGLKKSIALNQYQRSTQNPYKNQEVIRINKEYSTDVVNKNDSFKIPPRPKKVQEFSSPYIQRKTNSLTSTVRPSENRYQTKPNMKFLESVTKIYERSGRSDLADGLKNSINKAKQTI